jgi:hypothetical protein
MPMRLRYSLPQLEKAVTGIQLDLGPTFFISHLWPKALSLTQLVYINFMCYLFYI